MKILIANDKGGVGKSLIAQLCVLSLQQNNKPLHIIEYDNRPKLNRLFPEHNVISHGQIPDVVAVLQDEESILKFWDPMSDYLTGDDDLIVDFGAQAWDLFHQWSHESELASMWQGKEGLLIIPVTADLEAINGALKVLETARTFLPNIQILVLGVEKDGSIEMLSAISEYKNLLQSITQNPNAMMKIMPTLKSEAYPAFAAMGYRLDQIVSQDFHQKIDTMGLSPAVLNRSIRMTKNWLKSCYDILTPVFVKLQIANASKQITLPNAVQVSASSGMTKSDVFSHDSDALSRPLKAGYMDYLRQMHDVRK